MKVLQFTLPVAHGHSVIIQEDDLPYFYPYLHRHNEAQLTYITEGEGTLVAGTDMHPFKAGDIFFIGANQPHIFKSDPIFFAPDNKLRSCSLTIFFDPCAKLSSLFELHEMQLLQYFLKQHTSGFKIPSIYKDLILPKILAIRDTMNAGRLIEFIQLLQLLYGIRNELTPLTDVALDKMSESEGIRIGHIYNYVMQHYSSEIKLENIAAEVYMTPQAFCRYFKKHTGNTFVNFLNQLRINEVCKILSLGNIESIASVAYACGFNSITNFNRTFKNTVGSSPRQYLARYAESLVVN
ncbi:AraC family transcriptional regulator [Mucilaginibacter pocheonensis]|uniref:AraC-like DNA-binding protein n=1 Tax=Mucilaginibacter pocheonensis TaxID=398050 RepID=A0ABU1TCB3_9SPHI|nr:AraC family transcriptional regulator [Mucilaginibacter pocheonensis]MDR6942511.1 AraC-like DNA-binding protein [Mucilaginibacter pocheonensis]